MSAVFSDCGKYRWRLDRDLGRSGPVVCLPGVNPSSAGAEVNDATIRKDIGFGERHGWGKLIKVNKFAFISTDIKGLRTAPDPIGPENNRYLEEAFREADIIVGCWGLSESCRWTYASAGGLSWRLLRSLASQFTA